MSTLQTQYKNYLQENPTSKLTYDEWMEQIWTSYIRNFQIDYKEDLKFYRYTDEAGDEIRYRVYPILADIEQRFRAFINKALAEILGFDWWVHSVPEKINKVTSDRYSNSRKDQIAPHYLECTLFDDLIKLITINYCEFQDNLSFTNKEFDQLLQDCYSFDDLKLKWNQRKKILSYWEIFSKYFNDRKQWDDLKKELENFVINVRNKAMHHRPIRLCVIKKLDEIKEELIKVFDSAKSELSEEEIIEAKQEIQEILCYSPLTGNAKKAIDWLTEQEKKFQEF
jgi:hypothetical protein